VNVSVPSITVTTEPSAQTQYLTTLQGNDNDEQGRHWSNVIHGRCYSYATTVKSIAAAPPKASKKEIARARSRLLSKSSSHM